VLRDSVITILSLAILCCPWIKHSQAQSGQDISQYVQKARAAYQQKDYSTLIENLKQALAVRPNHASYTYNIAVGYALSGNQTEAYSWLNRLADMGLVYNVSADKDFASLKDTSEFKNLVQKFETNQKPVGNSTTAFTVHEKGLVPEGIAYDPVEKTFYLGSVYKRKILSIDQAGAVKDFSAPADGLWSVMGMRVDAARRVLWVCTASHPQMMDFNKAETGLSGIFKYDLRTKRLVKKYMIASTAKPHWLGDLMLNSRGDVFASDSVTPAIYVLDHRTDGLELFLENSAFVNPQGLAFSADEKKIFLADYLKGIFAIDVRSRTVSLIKPAPHTTMLGFDGLYSYRGTLVGVQNGVRPNRLVQLWLNSTATEVQKFEIREANNPIFDEPTLAVIAEHDLFYIANSQWETVDEQGHLAPAEKLHDPIVLKLRL